MYPRAMRRFEFNEGSSNKFWQIELTGDSFTVTWGRVGTNGQTQTKSFDSATKAETEHDKLVKEKIKKGYAEVDAGSAPAPAAAPTPRAAPAPKPKAASAPAAATATPAARPAPAAPAEPPPPALPEIVVTAGVAWTAEAKREVAPRRG